MHYDTTVRNNWLREKLLVSNHFVPSRPPSAIIITTVKGAAHFTPPPNFPRVPVNKTWGCWSSYFGDAPTTALCLIHYDICDLASFKGIDSMHNDPRRPGAVAGSREAARELNIANIREGNKLITIRLKFGWKRRFNLCAVMNQLFYTCNFVVRIY